MEIIKGDLLTDDTVKENREKYIGGSDIPSILNYSPWKTRWHLLLEKSNNPRLEEFVKPFQLTQAYIEYGNTMEEKIRNYWNEAHCPLYPFEKACYTFEDEGIRCNVDGINETTVMEIKTGGTIYESVNDYKSYIAQLLFYMKKTKRKHGLLLVYLRPEDFSEELDPMRIFNYEIFIDDYSKEVENIEKNVELFKLDVEKLKKNPDLNEVDLLPPPVTVLAYKVLSMEEQLKNMKKYEADVKKVREELRAEMDKRDIKFWIMPNGTKLINSEGSSVRMVKKIVFDEDRFKEDFPDVYKKYLIEKEFKEGKNQAPCLKIQYKKNTNIEGVLKDE